MILLLDSATLLLLLGARQSPSSTSRLSHRKLTSAYGISKIQWQWNHCTIVAKDKIFLLPFNISTRHWLGIKCGYCLARSHHCTIKQTSAAMIFAGGKHFFTITVILLLQCTYAFINMDIHWVLQGSRFGFQVWFVFLIVVAPLRFVFNTFGTLAALCWFACLLFCEQGFLIEFLGIAAVLKEEMPLMRLQQ